jgi:DNA-binding transcriptional MocR family regulator
VSIRAINWAREICARIEVPPGERLILWAICLHHHDATGECFPSYDTLAQETGFQRRKVIYAVDELSENGLIFIQGRRVNGHQGSNHFVLFGLPKAPAWIKSRVHKKAPCESAPECTQSRVHRSAPDRELVSIGEESPSRMRVISGGRS